MEQAPEYEVRPRDQIENDIGIPASEHYIYNREEEDGE